jgi:hypothetical protein
MVGTNIGSVDVVGAQTLTGLEILRNQTFATHPYQQHFDRWLDSLQTILEDLEASKVIVADTQFKEERIHITSEVKVTLEEERAKEAKRTESIRGLHGSRDLLFHAEQKHSNNVKEFSDRRNQKIKSLTADADALRSEVEEVINSKAGRFERFTKLKANREGEARSRLAEAEKRLVEARASFAGEEEFLQEEYNAKKQEILEKVAAERREIDRLEAESETDSSIEARCVACERLTLAVKALLDRTSQAART